SRNAHPGPELSGRYFSGDFPLVCVQVIPLFSGRTSSKGNWVSSGEAKTGKRGRKNAPASNREKSRREKWPGQVQPRICSQSTASNPLLCSFSWAEFLHCLRDKEFASFRLLWFCCTLIP